jgi:[ribosomal protein S5]-alanine N-acetyltransferase
MTRRLADLDLSTERVRLRPHRPADAAPAYAELAGRDEILRWLVWNGPGSVEELEEYYRHWRFDADTASDFRLAVEELPGGALAGSLTLRFAGHPAQGDIGYWIAQPFQRRGLAAEALALCAHLAFRHLLADSLYAWVFVGNTASRRLLERTGFTLVRSVPGRIVKNGKRVDEWHFALLRSEWQRLRADFRPRAEELRWEGGAGEPPAPMPSEAF